MAGPDPNLSFQWPSTNRINRYLQALDSVFTNLLRNLVNHVICFSFMASNWVKHKNVTKGAILRPQKTKNSRVFLILHGHNHTPVQMNFRYNLITPIVGKIVAPFQPPFIIIYRCSSHFSPGFFRAKNPPTNPHTSTRSTLAFRVASRSSSIASVRVCFILTPSFV